MEGCRIPALEPHESLRPVVEPQVCLSDAAAKLYSEIAPVVVKVETENTRGSGFFVSNDGTIRTSAHVVLNANKIYVTTFDREIYRAHLEKLDDIAGLADLKIDGVPPKISKLLPVNAAAEGMAGQPVFAFGYPGASESPYISRGFVQGQRRVYDIVDKNKTAETFSKLPAGGRTDLLDVLASSVTEVQIHLEPGESGGPLVNGAGEVVGVNQESDTDSLSSAFFTNSSSLKLFDVTKSKFSFARDFRGRTVTARIDKNVQPPFDWRALSFK